MEADRTGRLRRAYLAAALFWLNLCLCLLALNVLAGLLPRSRPSTFAGFAPAGAAALRAAYPQLGPEEIERLVAENVREFVYEPFTEFREKPFAGRYVNVDERGFRVTRGQGPWPPDPRHLNLLLFGGSTTFGYGVADGDTIASHLQARLQALGLPREPRVYNFGRGAYYSSQERALFERLLVEGVRPGLAVFVDGLNDFFFYDDRPAWTPRLAEVVAQGSGDGARAWRDALRALPLVRRVAALLPGADVRTAMAPAPPPRPDDPALLARVVDRYLANQRLIEAAAAAHGVDALFVWQPVPTYHHRPPDGAAGYGRHEYSRFGYPRMAELHAAGRAGERFVWCADVQQGARGLLYVDAVHYSPQLSDLLAACILEGLEARGALR